MVSSDCPFNKIFEKQCSTVYVIDAPFLSGSVGRTDWILRPLQSQHRHRRWLPLLFLPSFISAHDKSYPHTHMMKTEGENVPLTFQMSTFWYEMGCFQYIIWILHRIFFKEFFTLILLNLTTSSQIFTLKHLFLCLFTVMSTFQTKVMENSLHTRWNGWILFLFFNLYLSWESCWLSPVDKVLPHVNVYRGLYVQWFDCEQKYILNANIERNYLLDETTHAELVISVGKVEWKRYIMYKKRL